MKFQKVVTCLLVGLAICGSSLALANDVKGGDPVIARSELLKKFINEDLKSLLFQYVSDFPSQEKQGVLGEGIINSLILQGLKSDISQSPYATEDGSCYEDGVRKGAGTRSNSKKYTTGAPICFDPMFLAKESVTKRELLALALHEHAHHFTLSESQAREVEIYVSAKFQEDTNQNAWECLAYCFIRLQHPVWAAAGEEKEILMTKRGSSAGEVLKTLTKTCDQTAEDMKAATKKKRIYYTKLTTKGFNGYFYAPNSEPVDINNACRPVNTESHLFINR